MTAVTTPRIAIERSRPDAPILRIVGNNEIDFHAETVVVVDGVRHAVPAKPFVIEDACQTGTDFGFAVKNGEVDLVAIHDMPDPIAIGIFAGFHYAPSGCATGIAGGDGVPAINPFSVWDLGFRPSCADPRGMALVEAGKSRAWTDIYLLGTEQATVGTSRCGQKIADGACLPIRADGKGRYARLDYATAVEIYAHHGKRLLAAEEFFAAAYGVKERCSRDNEPETTGALEDGAERFVSRAGIFDATGTMWQWGTDGHPDDPRPSVFGGSWFYGAYAGSRCADLVNWPGVSSGCVSARGACDHLNPA